MSVQNNDSTRQTSTLCVLWKFYRTWFMVISNDVSKFRSYCGILGKYAQQTFCKDKREPFKPPTVYVHQMCNSGSLMG